MNFKNFLDYHGLLEDFSADYREQHSREPTLYLRKNRQEFAAIEFAFPWRHSFKGFKFWSKVNEAWYSNLMK